MVEDEEIPNFRKFDPRAALRTTLYAVLTLVALFMFSWVGFGALLLIREGARSWRRRQLRSFSAQLRQDYLTADGRTAARTRMATSPLAHAMVLELVAQGVWLLLMLGWYIWRRH